MPDVRVQVGDLQTVEGTRLLVVSRSWGFHDANLIDWEFLGYRTSRIVDACALPTNLETYAEVRLGGCTTSTPKEKQGGARRWEDHEIWTYSQAISMRLSNFVRMSWG